MDIIKRKKEQDKVAKQSYSIVKANVLIQQSRFYLNTQEQKIILYLISKIQPDDDEFKSYAFHINEFCRICEIDDNNGKNYKNIKDTLKGLRDKSIWVEIAKGRHTTLGWLSCVTIDENSGVVDIKLDDRMKPFLLQLKEHFTQYSFYYILAMKSQYSIKIYELLKSYEYRGVCEFPIDDLKKMLGAEHYERHADFQRKVLDTALREINGYSDITAEYFLEKTGKKFTDITFQIRTVKNAKKRFDNLNNIGKKLNKGKDELAQPIMLEPGQE
jgi:plasmid replication initiation protein